MRIEGADDVLSDFVRTTHQTNFPPILRGKLFPYMARQSLVVRQVSAPMNHTRPVSRGLRNVAGLLVNDLHRATMTRCFLPVRPGLRSPVSETKPFRISAENLAVIEEYGNPKKISKMSSAIAPV